MSERKKKSFVEAAAVEKAKKTSARLLDWEVSSRMRKGYNSIPQLRDHVDTLGIKLKQYDTPALGIQGVPLGRSKNRNTSRRPLSSTRSTDLSAIFNDGVNNTVAQLTRKSKSVKNSSGNVPQSYLLHPLMSDKELVSDEMVKLHQRLSSNMERTLDSEPLSRREKNPIKNATSDSQRSLKAINNRIENKVTEWMKNNPNFPDVLETSHKREKMLETATPTVRQYNRDDKVHKRLREISDNFHKSLSDATGTAKDWIDTPSDDLIHELSRKTKDSLAKISVTDRDIEMAFQSAIRRESSSINRESQREPEPEVGQFKPLHTDKVTQKKLHDYINRRMDPLSPRPPRKDFTNDYVNATVLFKGTDKTSRAEVQRRVSLIAASEPEIFQRKIDSGELDNHRRIVDPHYPHAPLNQRNFNWNSDFIAQSNSNKIKTSSVVSGIEMEKIYPERAGLIIGTLPESGKNHNPNSRKSASISGINKKLENSVKNIDDATKVAKALGSLISRVALTKRNNADPVEITELLAAPPVGSKALRPLATAEQRNDDIIDLATELCNMAAVSKKSYKSALKKSSKKFDTTEQKIPMKATALPLFPGVSYTDQMLLKKLKAMEDSQQN